MDARQFSKQKEALRTSGEIALVLEWDHHGDPIVLDTEQAIVIGRSSDADIQFPLGLTSRVHASIQWKDSCFMLQDLSTNGSFLRTEDEQVRFIRRHGVRLWGEGSISFGGSDFSHSVLKYSHVSG